MGIDIQKEKVVLNKVTHSVRASQAVLQYGVGAMVDFPDQTLMTAAPEYWAERVEHIHDERLEKILHVDYFGMPGNSDEIQFAEGISYARFPEWYFCPKCRRFQPLSSWINEYKQSARPRELENDPYMVKHMRCPICHQDLVVARIVTACDHGHIDDFPWEKWVHCQSVGGPKRICSNPKLTFKTGASSTEGLEGLEITCETCHAKANLRGAFDSGKLEDLDKKYPGQYNFMCTGRHPWRHSKEQCNLYPRVLQRGSSSVYFPIISSSLVIPPYSSILTTRIENSKAFAECKTTISNAVPSLPADMKQGFIGGMIDSFASKIAIEISASEDQVKGVLNRKWLSPSNEECSTTSVKYRAEEYEALKGDIVASVGDSGDFLRESTNINEYDLPFIKNISLIHKIREVQALTGFTRLKPAEQDEVNQSTLKNVVPVKSVETNWYPAYQVRGEGIFIEFDEEFINLWRTGNDEAQRRVNLLNSKYNESFIGSNRPRKITSKYLLIHTISHLLIKQLSFECGYSIASLKERLYCSEAADGKIMSGILIYTASGDSEGTMGGLVRQGRPDTFPAIFKKAIESAMTCSNDPVCSLSSGQGRDSLNMAACYSCALIPETSCEDFNIFLDRGVVVGTYNEPNFGFFSSWLYGKQKWKKETENSNTGTSEVSCGSTLIPQEGTDVSALNYETIWNNLIQWSKNETEKNILNEFKKKSELFDGKEKPVQDCDFMISGGAEVFSCDLLWKNNHIALFTSDNEDAYNNAKPSNWRCFITSDETLSAELLAAAIVR